PVVPLQANKGKGVEELKEAISRAIENHAVMGGPDFPEAFEKEVRTLRTELGEGINPFLVRRLLLDVGGYTEKMLLDKHGNGLADHVREARQRLAQAGCGVPAIEARTRYGWIRTATQGCIQRPAQRVVTWTDRIDRVLTHKVWGTLIFLLLMFIVFESIFTLA